ncbi:hypothetical protein ARTHRO8AJ_330049 [Arthrobacter sp. 8AJ]|nr:hypothetical protein ARTHRO8AJ_330049 [Arthrobacter sp. 8AJ]
MAPASRRAPPSIAARGDVSPEPPFRRDVLDVADSKPYLPRLNARGQGLVSGASAYAGKDQGTAQHAGVPRTELVIHETPVLADSHR